MTTFGEGWPPRVEWKEVKFPERGTNSQGPRWHQRIRTLSLQGRRPQERVSAIPQEVLDFTPEAELQSDAKLFAKCLQSAPSGSSPGLGGCTYEMIKVCLDDWETLQLLTSVCGRFRQGHITRSVEGILPCHLHSIAEEGWRSEGHRDRQCFPTFGCKDFGQTIQFSSGNSMRPIPIRSVDQGRH